MRTYRDVMFAIDGLRISYGTNWIGGHSTKPMPAFAKFLLSLQLWVDCVLMCLSCKKRGLGAMTLSSRFHRAYDRDRASLERGVHGSFVGVVLNATLSLIVNVDLINGVLRGSTNLVSFSSLDAA